MVRTQNHNAPAEGDWDVAVGRFGAGGHVFEAWPPQGLYAGSVAGSGSRRNVAVIGVVGLSIAQTGHTRVSASCNA